MNARALVIGMYVLYVLLLSVLTGLGLNVVFASHLISAVAVLIDHWSGHPGWQTVFYR